MGLPYVRVLYLHIKLPFRDENFGHIHYHFHDSRSLNVIRSCSTSGIGIEGSITDLQVFLGNLLGFTATA